MSAGYTPPGWPPGVPPPGVAGWEEAAVSWLLDQCPADYRGYAAWRRHPFALAWIAARHLEAQVTAMRSAYREARVEVGARLTPEGMADVLAAIEVEGLRLRAASRSAALLAQALDGSTWTPRL